MKPDIHPDYHEITVVMTNGDSFKTYSTLGKPGERLLLDVDFRSHPAWVGGVAQLNTKANKVASFNKRFAGIGFGGAAAAPAAAAEDKKDE